MPRPGGVATSSVDDELPEGCATGPLLLSIEVWSELGVITGCCGSSVGRWEAAIFGCIGLANLSGFAME